MKYFLVIIITIIVLTTMFSGCNYTQDHFNNVITNEKIIQSKSFILSSESTELETSVRGTVFLSGGTEGVPEHTQIVALIEIDPEDWGGVVFYIPENWHISNITSSYPENETPQKKPEDFVSIWRTGSTTVEWNREIRIGASHSTPTGGGKGTIIIELDANRETMSTTETFSMLVGVGSEEKDGVRILYPDFERIKIPIP